MEFHLTYAGSLYSTQAGGAEVAKRSLHVHKIRQVFHLQLQTLWRKHPTLAAIQSQSPDIVATVPLEGFNWRPLVTDKNGLICKLDILMLRYGAPGRVMADIDNRLKTLFDALRMPSNAEELGARTSDGQAKPDSNHDPFFVLLEEDRLITHVSVTTDTILEPVVGVPQENAVRLVVGVTIKPYHAHADNLDFV